jgi:outer membrane protein TolC
MNQPFPSLYRLFLFIACLIPIILSGQPQNLQEPTYEYSLDQAIAYALGNNLNIQNARFDEYMADKEAKSLIARGYPQISASGEIINNIKIPTSLVPAEFFDPTAEPGTFIPIQFGTPWGLTAGFDLNQMVFDGAFFLGLKAAETFVELRSKGILATEIDVATNVAKAYYTALISQEGLETYDLNLARLEKTLNDTRALQAEGFVEKIDVQRLEISYNNLVVDRKNIQNLIDLSKDMLKFQMGLPVYTDIILTEKIDPDGLQSLPEPENLVDFVFENRIEYSMLQTQRKLNEFDMKRWKVQYYPTLYAFGSYKWNAQRDKFNFFNFDEEWFPAGIVGLSLNVPIFDGFYKKSKVDQARMQIRKTENNMELLRNSIRLEIKNAYANLMIDLGNLESLRNNVELAEKVLEVSEIKYKEGVGSGLELTDAETTLRQAQNNYLRGLLDYLLDLVDFSKAKGQMLNK